MEMSEYNYWKQRALVAEEALNDLSRKVFACGNRSMSLEGRTFIAENGCISDENFDFDAMLKVTGDFVGDERQHYAAMIAAALNSLTHNAGNERTPLAGGPID